MPVRVCRSGNGSNSVQAARAGHWAGQQRLVPPQTEQNSNCVAPPRSAPTGSAAGFGGDAATVAVEERLTVPAPPDQRHQPSSAPPHRWL